MYLTTRGGFRTDHGPQATASDAPRQFSLDNNKTPKINYI
jgi:hypothetical protein